MSCIDLKGRRCSYATPKPDGNLFWQTCVYDGENETHYFFLVNGKLLGVLRANVFKIEFESADSKKGAI